MDLVVELGSPTTLQQSVDCVKLDGVIAVVWSVGSGTNGARPCGLAGECKRKRCAELSRPMWTDSGQESILLW